jgi:ribose 5-phosphate isomerase B
MYIPSETELHAIVHRVVQHTIQGTSVPASSSSASSTPASSIPASITPGLPAAAASPQQAVAAEPAQKPGQVVALGADHGGFAMKESLKSFVAEQGYQVIDCGAHSTEAVDYPDLALAVARLVSDGKAWRGIIVDGAGIGSCMVANKVPGVRAALCYDHATANNSREHNDANVLTLGAGLIGDNLARQIVKTWLVTPFGGGRHAKRVEKIMDVEKQFLVKK